MGAFAFYSVVMLPELGQDSNVAQAEEPGEPGWGNDWPRQRAAQRTQRPASIMSTASAKSEVGAQLKLLKKIAMRRPAKS
eukprot:1610863-Alexandrium_andersonii.AAC.1